MCINCSNLDGEGVPRQPGIVGIATADPIEQVVLDLKRICRASALEFALSVGKVVVFAFFGGDVVNVKGRIDTNVSYRKLARHPELPMSPATLCRSVAIYAFCQQTRIENWHHNSVSHIKLVLPLPPEQQIRLLDEADRNRWPTRRLREELVATVASTGRQANSNSRKHLKMTLRALERCIDESNQFVGLGDSHRDFSPDSVRSVQNLLERVRTACDCLEDRLPGRFTRIPPAASEVQEISRNVS
jgi:hypothetical protein